MDCKTLLVAVQAIKICPRIRKDTGELKELAADIKRRGLINPITIMDCGDGTYQLVAGLRRLEAMKSLGFSDIRASILSPLAADEQLSMEYAENVQRRDFTVVERTEYAAKIKAVEQAKARERKSIHARDGYGVPGQEAANWPPPEKGESRDIIAKKAGFTSATQMRRVEAIAEKNPRLLEKIDSGEMSIHAAFQQTVQDSDAESGKKVFMEPLSETPQRVKHTATDPVFRAGHERLMKNPLYMNLRAQLKEAEYEANRAKSKLERETEFYANQVKHFTSNIDALKVQCNQLRVENTALRAQLASIPAEGENHEQ